MLQAEVFMHTRTSDHGLSRAELRRRLSDLIALAERARDRDAVAQQIDALVDALAADPADEERRIVVTGMGAVTPLGGSVAELWNGLVEGRSGARQVTQCDTAELPSQIAAEVPDFEPQRYMEPKEVRRVSRASQFAVAAAQMAMADSGLAVTDTNRHQIGTLIANGSTSPPDTETMIRASYERRFARVGPFYLPAALPNMPACQVAISQGLMGYSSSIATACAASAQAIGEAAEIIRRGDAVAMLAGGTEAPISRLALGSFAGLRALSTRNSDPERASRPFDAQRDGFVLGEGAGVLVLEQLAHARRRGARIYAELTGYASSCDAHHVTAPHPAGEGAYQAMVRALARAGIAPEQVDYVNAHATSTPVGDVIETLALKRVFGPHAARMPISAPKSMLGHMTSAAGVVEAIATILTICHGIVPPTINYETPDPACDLDYVPNRARHTPVRTAMSNSFGFGGINGVLVFQRLD
jgi:3-oxoacyl-[acyl-carrier-protein] synthase II